MTAVLWVLLAALLTLPTLDLCASRLRDAAARVTAIVNTELGSAPSTPGGGG